MNNETQHGQTKNTRMSIEQTVIKHIRQKGITIYGLQATHQGIRSDQVRAR